MNWLGQKKAVFAGCARDSAVHLPALFANIEGMAALFGKSAFVFVENGSADSTRGDLEAWCRRRPDAGVLSPDTRAAASNLRSMRIAGARNAYLSLIRAVFADFDYLIVNDEFGDALAELRAIVVARRLRRDVQYARHAALIGELLKPA